MRRALFWAALAASAAVTAALWAVGIRGAFLLLLFPFVFWPRRGPPPHVRTCPACGFCSADPETKFCPRDGTQLG